MSQQHIFWIWLVPLLGAATNLLVVPLLRIRSRWFSQTVAVGSVAISFFVALSIIFPIPGLSANGGDDSLLKAFHAWREAGSPHGAGPVLQQQLYTWIESGSLHLDLAFRIDTLSSVMVLVVTFVGSLIHIYSTGYMAHEKRFANYFGYLNLFMGSMLILVLADSLPVMFIGWEGVGLCSYLLIGFWFEKTENANAGRKAFIVNRIGDFAFILGMLLLFWGLTNQPGVESSGLSWSELTDSALATVGNGGPGLYNTTSYFREHFATWAAILLFIGACGKSAQIPLYVWLPDAMAGPTPVSALIHAATMVTAGVYMVARLSVLYASSTTAMAIVAGVGALTALVAAFMAFAQTDFKKVLAYSTVSQLGFMFVAVGVGAHVAGIFHLVTHAFFKAGLFLAAGSVMHAMSGSGDITKMGGLRKKLRWTHASFIIYCLAIAGFPLLSGFFSKDEILAGAFGSQQEGWLVIYGKGLWLVLSVAAAGTAIYMFRLYFLVFHGDKTRCDAETESHIHESPASMTVPLVILAIGTLLLGLIGLPHLSAFHGVASALPFGQLADWLEPSLVGFAGEHGGWEVGAATRIAGELSAGTTWVLLGVATVVGLTSIGIAYVLYQHGPSAAVNRMTAKGPGAALLRLSKNKLYVDELYEWSIIRPFRWLAHATWQFADKFVIDTIFVSGTAFVVDMTGRAVRWFQNGQVQRYITALLVGGALLFYFASKPSAELTVETQESAIGGVVEEVLGIRDRNDDPAMQQRQLKAFLRAKKVSPFRVTLHGSAGHGPGSIGAELKWYRDGEQLDKFDDKRDVVLDFGKAGEYQITLEATDAVFGHTKRVTRKVTLRDPFEVAAEFERDALAAEAQR